MPDQLTDIEARLTDLEEALYQHGLYIDWSVRKEPKTAPPPRWPRKMPTEVAAELFAPRLCPQCSHFADGHVHLGYKAGG